MKAYIFPGQGSQFTGMCHDLFLKYDTLKPLFTKAEEILELEPEDKWILSMLQNLASNVSESMDLLRTPSASHWM